MEETAGKPVTIRRATGRDDPAMESVERIYVGALPGGERKPVAWLRDIPARPQSYHTVVAERSGIVLGFAVLFVPQEGHDAALLEYLAVDESARGGGVGGMLFRDCVRRSNRPILVEVETGDACAGRRKKFYERHGCRAVMGLQYLLPLAGAGPMALMVAGPDGIARADLGRWIGTIYAEVYGQSRDDPRVMEMVSRLAGTVKLK